MLNNKQNFQFHRLYGTCKSESVHLTLLGVIGVFCWFLIPDPFQGFYDGILRWNQTIKQSLYFWFNGTSCQLGVGSCWTCRQTIWKRKLMNLMGMCCLWTKLSGDVVNIFLISDSTCFPQHNDLTKLIFNSKNNLPERAKSKFFALERSEKPKTILPFTKKSSSFSHALSDKKIKKMFK